MKKETKKNFKEAIINTLILTNIVGADIIFCISYYCAKILKEVNFYEYVYMFNSDNTGSSIIMIIDGIKTCLLAFVIIFIILFIPLTNFQKIKISLKYKGKEKDRNFSLYPTKLLIPKYALLYSVIILLLSVFTISKVVKVDEYFENITQTSYIYETYYQNTNSVNIKFPNNKKNLILLYLESMESSLVSRENGGAFEESRIPELEILALENTNFSNTKNIGGAYNLDSTSWTLAATVASSSSTPILAKLEHNYSKVEYFMPKVKALGDVLKNEGYNLELIQGTDARFSGMNKYFKTHGDYKIFDYNTAIEKGLISESYYEWWGYEDKKLFKYASDEILNLSKEDKPFAITLFTMDTHFKDGYLDSSCEEPFEDKLSNVYRCSSKMVGEFISWVQNQDFYKDTVIVIIGDHLTMQGEYYNDYPKYNRTIFNTFINSSLEEKNNKNREFSSLDIYPTILASLGATIEGDKIGFGVNLYSGKKTLIEELGYDRFNKELSKSSPYYHENIFSEENKEFIR